MTAARHVTLPPERHEQLKLLAEQLGCSLADAMGWLLNIVAQAGIIPRALPGLSVERTGMHVAVDLGGGRKLLPLDAAERYAKHVLGTAGLLPVDAAARYEAAVRRYSEITGGPLNVLPDSGLGAVRRGAGVKLLDPENGAEKVVAPSVAQEFAIQISQAAKA